MYRNLFAYITVLILLSFSCEKGKNDTICNLKHDSIILQPDANKGKDVFLFHWPNLLASFLTGYSPAPVEECVETCYNVFSM